MKRIERALEYLHKKYPHQVSPEDLSEEVELDLRTLQAGFREKTGLTIHNYQFKKRIEKAMTELPNIELSLKIIAHRNGFKNTSQFGKAFKKFTGQTPMQYRRQLLA